MKSAILIGAVSLLLVPGANAAAISTPTEDLRELVGDIEAKRQSGPITEADLTAEIARFDALLERYAGQQSADVAQILFLKGTLYRTILNRPEQAREILKQVIRDFPDTPQATRSEDLLDAMDDGIAITRIRESDTINSNFPDFQPTPPTVETPAITRVRTTAAPTPGSLVVGAMFPDFAERDTDGRPISVAQYRGKVVLVDFWAMWCGPCLAELPNVISAYNKYHDDGFEIIGISLDRTGDGPKLAVFTSRNRMPWPQYFDGGYWGTKLAVRYNIHSIPASYLIDRDGRIAAVNPRGRTLEQEIVRVLNQ